MDHSAVVSETSTTSDEPSGDSSKQDSSQQGQSVTPAQQSNSTAPSTKDEIDCMQIIRENLARQGVSSHAAEVIFSSWRLSTQRQYWVHLRRWLLFSQRRGCDSLNPSVNDILEFLSDMFYNNKLGYSSLNTAR